MASSVWTKVKYSRGAGSQYSDTTNADKLTVYEAGRNQVQIEFSQGKVLRGAMRIPASIAIDLARVILIVAEGYTTRIEAKLP